MKDAIALITGATSGFGKAIAELFAQQGMSIIITGRRQERLTKLRNQLTEKYAVRVLDLCFDVRDRSQVESHLGSLPDTWSEVDILINNAGLALGRDPIHQGQWADWEQMIDTNIKGLLYVSKVVSSGMVQRKKGTIINIGSIAGREAYAGGNVYSATKFAVDSLTKNMRIDLAPFGIRVGQIAPGAAETEFSVVRFHGDQQKADEVYKGFHPLVAQDIAEAAWFMVSRPAHVCINDIWIMPTAQSNASTINRH
ncbi:MAG: SDR family oxidoreductase [Flavobacteriales bacterium]